METNANKKRREVEFSVGDKVLVKLRPYRQISVAKRLSNKLSKRFYGPFEVSERVGKVAYRLLLPETSKIHPVFHVSVLRRYNGEVEAGGVHVLPVDFEEGGPIEQPLSICGVRSVLSRGKPTTQVLVQWTNSSPENATWEGLREFKLAYPDFHLEDKVLFEEEGNDTQPTVEGPRRTGRVSVAPKWQQDFVMDKA
ncbi:ty3-gypsy retrotransposon protein [Tanacetum coccineum]